MLIKSPTYNPLIFFRMCLTPSSRLPVKSTTIVLIWVLPYLARTASETSLSLSEFQPTKIRFSPFRANWKAKALPMPSVGPVTSAQDPYFLRFLAGLRKLT
ncbi:hypothetical protein ACFXTO_002472 [Malus domestica]